MWSTGRSSLRSSPVSPGSATTSDRVWITGRRLTEYDLTDRVVVITGATSGLGLSAARAFLGAGATVEILGRDAAKTAAVCERLRADDAPGSVGSLVADTGNLDAVRRVCDELADRHGAIHALIHNAGALDKEYALSPQGIERTVASQVVGPFLMTGLLLPLLRARPGARVLCGCPREGCTPSRYRSPPSTAAPTAIGARSPTRGLNARR